MSISKKFYSLVLAILAVFALVGCDMGGNGGNTNDPEPVEGITLSDAQALVNKAIGKIGWAETDLEVVGDLTFATSNSFAPGVVISWASSNEAVISVDGKVTRPEYGQGDATVTITATYSIAYNLDDNGNTVDEVYSDTESWTFVVKEAGEVFNIAKLEAQIVAGEIESGSEATITGVIVAKMASNQGNQIFVHDGSAGIYVYTASDLAVGTEVQVSGTVDIYYEIFQIKNAGITVVNENAQLPEATKTTLGEHMAKGKDSGKIGGELINVDVLLEIVTEQYTNVYITDPKTGDKARVYYKTEYTYIPGYNGETDYMAALQPYNGKTINITLVQYDIKDGEGHRLMLTSYPITEVQAQELTDEEKAEFILNGINLPSNVNDALTLPAQEGLTWAVKEGTGITISEGVATVTPAAEAQVVVLTATATVNQVVLTKDFTVTVNPTLPEPTQTTIADLLANKPTAEKAEIFVVTGIWTLDAGKETYGNGKLADEAGNTIVIYGLCKDDSVVSFNGTSYTYSNNKSYASIGLNDGAVIKVGMLYTPNFDNYSAYIIEIVANGDAPAHQHVACPTCGLCTAADCDGAEEVKCAGHQDAPVIPSAGVEAGVAYYIKGKNADGDIYFNGTISGGRFNCSASTDGAVKVYVEVVDGLYLIYFNDASNVKQYIIMGDSTTQGSFTTDASAATVFEWNADINTLVVELDSNNRTFATDITKTYLNYSAYDISGSYEWAQFVPADGGQTPDQPVVPSHTHVACPTCGLCTAADCDGAADVKCAGHEVAPEASWVVVNGVEADKAYKLGFYQEQNAKHLYLTGNMKGYYGETTEVAENAADVYAVVVEGGYKLKVVKADGTVSYIALVVSGTYNNFKFVDEASASIFTYDEAANTMVTARSTDSLSFFMGTYGTNVTFGMSDYAKYIATSYVSHFYALSTGTETPDTPVEPEVPTHEHVACPVCGLCIAEECDGTGDEICAGHEEEPETPVVSGGKADLETIDTKQASGGIGQYTTSYTSTNGWVTVNSAILVGGTSDANPVFMFIGADKTIKAAAINGKVGASGTLTSPTLTGGISKITFNYGHAFKEANGVDINITITEVATGRVVVFNLVKENSEVTQKVAYVAEFVLETPVTGEFTIVFSNNSPSNSTSSNKDRVALWNIEWVGAAGTSTPDTPVEPEVPAHEHVACPTCGLCTAEDCDGAADVKCAGHVVEPEVPAHEHVACPTCGLCTAEDCDGAADVKCAGHEVVEPETPAAGVEAGVAYYIKGKNANGDIYFSGTITSGRYNCSASTDGAVKVYVEVVDGLYLIYFNDASSVKQYIVMGDSTTKGSFTTDASAATVFEWNADLNTLVVAEDSNNRTFATDITKTYLNYSAYDISGSYEWAQFVAVAE